MFFSFWKTAQMHSKICWTNLTSQVDRNWDSFYLCLEGVWFWNSLTRWCEKSSHILIFSRLVVFVGAGGFFQFFPNRVQFSNRHLSVWAKLQPQMTKKWAIINSKSSYNMTSIYLGLWLVALLLTPLVALSPKSQQIEPLQDKETLAASEDRTGFRKNRGQSVATVLEAEFGLGR